MTNQILIPEPQFSILLSILAALCWGLNAIIIKLGMKDENQYYALFLRSSVTVPILFAIVLIWKGIPGLSIYLTNPIFLYTFASASLIFLGDTLFLLSLKRYSVNIIAPVSSIYPIFTTLVLIISGLEVISLIVIIATIVIITGVFVVTSGDLSGTYEAQAVLMGVISAFCWGSSVVLVRLVLDNPATDAMGITGVRILLIGLAAFVVYRSNPVFVQSRRERSNESKRSAFLYMAVSGIFGWVLGASFFFFAVQRIGAAIPTPISSTAPIITAILGSLMGIESLSIKQFVGIIFCVVGVLLIVL